MAIPIKQETLELSEFQRILSIGLGRAILYLQQHSASPYRDAILYACLNMTLFDPQSESSRSDYLWEVLETSGEREFYKVPLLEALAGASSSPNDDYRLSQLFELALGFADEGDRQAVEVIHQKFAENGRSGSMTGDFAVIGLDGLPGLVAVLKQAISIGLLEEFDWRLDYSIKDAEDDFGESATWAALDAAAADDASLREFLARSRDAAPELISRTHDRVNEEDIRIALDEDKSLPSGWPQWASKAPSTMIDTLAAEVLTEQNPQRLFSLLQLFRERDFPLALDRMIQLAEYGDDRIEYDRMSFFAINALKRITHPDVRAVALRMIRNNNRVGRAIGLLQKNFEQNDWQLITELSKKSFAAEDYHSLGWSVRDVFKEHPSSEAGETFINLYEYGVCSQCRERYVEILHQLNQLPNWMLEECKYDANFYLRERVQNGFSSVEA